MNAIPLLHRHPTEVITLPSGARLLVRAMAPPDVPALRRMHGRLSDLTIYRRFMAACPRVSDRTLAYLANVDHFDREAIVATHRGEIVGVARFHRTAPADAEIAVVVEDAWQRRGIARALIERLTERARAAGVLVFAGSMLADNRPAIALLDALFPSVERRVAQGELEFRATI